MTDFHRLFPRLYVLVGAIMPKFCESRAVRFQRMALCQIGPKDENERTPFQRFANRTMWVIGTFRNSIVVVVSSYVSYAMISSTGHDVTSDDPPPIPFKVVGMCENRSSGVLINIIMYVRSIRRCSLEYSVTSRCVPFTMKCFSTNDRISRRNVVVMFVRLIVRQTR